MKLKKYWLEILTEEIVFYTEYKFKKIFNLKKKFG